MGISLGNYLVSLGGIALSVICFRYALWLYRMGKPKVRPFANMLAAITNFRRGRGPFPADALARGYARPTMRFNKRENRIEIGVQATESLWREMDERT